MLLLDRQGLCLKTNKAGIRFTGIMEERLVGSSFFDLWPENFRHIVVRAFKRTIMRKKPHSFEAVYRRPDGKKSILSVLLGPVMDSKGRLTQVIGISTDITMLKPEGRELIRMLDTEEGSALTLTTREKETLSLMAHGKSTASISHTLKISERTVKFHVGNILRKLNATSRTHAVAIALDLGLIEKN